VNKAITYTEKDKHNLAQMAAVLPLAPEKAAELLEYAYGLGFCQGGIVAATNILANIPDKGHDTTSRPVAPHQQEK
jgi:hypothetical protein